jgi:hypothetical protein
MFLGRAERGGGGGRKLVSEPRELDKEKERERERESESERD